MSQETLKTEFAALLTGLETSLFFASDTVEPECVLRLTGAYSTRFAACYNRAAIAYDLSSTTPDDLTLRCG